MSSVARIIMMLLNEDKGKRAQRIEAITFQMRASSGARFRSVALSLSSRRRWPCIHQTPAQCFRKHSHLYTHYMPYNTIRAITECVKHILLVNRFIFVFFQADSHFIFDVVCMLLHGNFVKFRRGI